MVLSIIWLIIGIIIWLEVIIKLVAYKGCTAATTFLSYPFGIPMPSMFIGLIVRLALLVVGTIGIYRFFA